MNEQHETLLRARVQPNDGATSAVWRIYEDLRSRIINLSLPPDSVLNRAELATSYGVSQTPVREALQLLEQDGLVRVFPQSRTIVARISVRELQETQFLRVALETEVMRRSAEAPDPAVLAKAGLILRKMQALGSAPEEMQTFHDLDRDFHGVFFEGLGLRALHSLLLRRLGHLARCQRLELPRDGKVEEIIAAHRAILEAVATQGPEAAAEAMRRHITGTITRISGLREQYPDHFADT